MAETLTLGMDVGSTTSKCLILGDGKEILASAVVREVLVVEHHRVGGVRRLPENGCIVVCDHYVLGDVEVVEGFFRFAGEVVGRSGHKAPHQAVAVVFRRKFLRFLRGNGVVAARDVRAIVDDCVIYGSAAGHRKRCN